jgi:MucB/RseB N-terminal domain
MKQDEPTIRACSLNEAGTWLSIILLVLLPLCVSMPQTAAAQEPGSISPLDGPLTTAQVVENLVAMNLRRSQALHSYRGSRTYRVEYQGFPRTAKAEMVVDVTYRAPGTKEFTIRSSAGSQLIIDRVFKKLLQAEVDALSADAQQRTALSSDNYDFTMAGHESTASRSMYVLRVEPKTKSRFLFRGRVWVDGIDFAVVRVEAEPAKSPSFWTKISQIEQSYMKVSDFWLPERNHSVSSIRFGGRAELTIDYQSYQITASDPVARVPGGQIARWEDTTLSHSPHAN